jgi:hypothetical protein
MANARNVIPKSATCCGSGVTKIYGFSKKSLINFFNGYHLFDYLQLNYENINPTLFLSIIALFKSQPCLYLNTATKEQI